VRKDETVQAVVVALIVAVGIVAFFALTRTRKKTTQRRDFASTQEMMEYFSNEAVRAAQKQFRKKLDFSVRSIEQVEDMLGEIHENYVQTKNEEGLFGLALIFGGYVGAVIKKDTGKGTWEKEHPDFGPEAFPLYYDQKACWFPVSWCYKRIMDGKGDDIVSKYRLLVTERSGQEDS
jgi:hypothetical protein